MREPRPSDDSAAEVHRKVGAIPGIHFRSKQPSRSLTVCLSGTRQAEYKRNALSGVSSLKELQLRKPSATSHCCKSERCLESWMHMKLRNWKLQSGYSWTFSLSDLGLKVSGLFTYLVSFHDEPSRLECCSPPAVR